MLTSVTKGSLGFLNAKPSFSSTCMICLYILVIFVISKFEKNLCQCDVGVGILLYL